MAEITIALKNGVLTSIRDVDRGLACGCLCPFCGSTLMSKQGDVREWHFSHVSKVACVPNSESIIHLYAKFAIERYGIMLPEHEIDFSGWPHFGFLCEFAPEYIRKSDYEVKRHIIKFDRCEIEKQHQDITPDVTGFVGKNVMFIEIAYSHFCGNEKVQKIRDYKVSCVEVDLSILKPERNLMKLERRIKDIITNGFRTKWIYSNRAESAESQYIQTFHSNRMRILSKRLSLPCIRHFDIKF